MNTLHRIIAVALAGATGLLVPVTDARAQVPAPDKAVVIGQVARSADERLSKGIAELNALREQVASEKLPLSQDLTRLEERVTNLRKENDRVSRLVAAGALDIASVKAEIKARQDELSYVGNLLDEYARTFEQKLHPVELQQWGAAVTAAKEAAENKSLSPTDRFARQTGFVDTSIKRVTEVVGGMRFAGTAVDMLGSVAEGQFAMIGPVALFRANTGLAGIAVPQAGSDKPIVRTLDEEGKDPTVSTLVAQGEGTLPLDPSRGGALKALVQKTNLVHLFIKGGPIMWPILVASILALGVVLERVFFLLNDKRKRNRRLLNQFFGEVEKGQLDAAIALSHKTKDCIATTLGYALENRQDSLDDALAYAQSRTLKTFRRGIPVLDTVITLAPLLGLLGTVTGMMGSFSVIGGDLSSPGAITGGIAEALIATAAGLGIAITCLLPFNYLNAKIEEIENDLASAAARLRLAVERVERKGKAAHAVEHKPAAAVTAGGA